MASGILTQSSSFTPNPVSLTFGRYRLFERIGAGGMAEVFRAVATGPEDFQRTLVIKRILPHLSQDSAFVQMFIDEAKVSGLLSHPNLVQIFEFGKIDDSFFIAMEHVHGRTLAATQKAMHHERRLIPVPAATEIARQLCTGLEYAHSLRAGDGRPLGIVHRDITPSNLMLTFHGTVKILDFGIARVADGLRQTQTQVGALKGKVSYMSPEQIQLHPVDHRSDFFSLGVVLHEMLAGRRLFRADSEIRTSRMVLEMPIQPPSLHNPAVPTALDRIVLRALARDVEARYPTAAAMAADLEQVMLEERMSPREHIKMLHQMFPHEAMMAADTGVVVPSAGATPMPGASAAEPAFVPTGAPHRRVRLRVALMVGVLSLALVGALVGVAAHGRDTAGASRVVPAVTATAAAEADTTGARGPRSVRCSLDSTPQDATVVRVESGEVVGRTPVTIALRASDKAIVFRFEKPGYRLATSKVIPDLDKALRIDLVAAADPTPAVVAGPTASATTARAPAGQGKGRKKAARATAKASAGDKDAAQQFRSASPINPFDM